MHFDSFDIFTKRKLSEINPVNSCIHIKKKKKKKLNFYLNLPACNDLFDLFSLLLR